MSIAYLGFAWFDFLGGRSNDIGIPIQPQLVALTQFRRTNTSSWLLFASDNVQASAPYIGKEQV